jgi:hypothetical protein
MTRLIDVWRALVPERRTTALVSLGLFVSMLLPWYSKTVVEHGRAAQASESAFQAFSFVEAAVLLVSAGVLTLLFARAEGRDFQLPGGDGTIITIAGAWAAILIFYRMLDKPSLHGNQTLTTTVGIEWGIFIALLLALGLAYTGRRIRAGEHAGPPLAQAGGGAGGSGGPSRTQPGREDRAAAGFAEVYEDDEELTERLPSSSREQLTSATRVVEARTARREPDEAATEPARAPRQRPRYPPSPSAPAEQMSFEDAPPEERD